MHAVARFLLNLLNVIFGMATVVFGSGSAETENGKVEKMQQVHVISAEYQSASEVKLQMEICWSQGRRLAGYTRTIVISALNHTQLDAEARGEPQYLHRVVCGTLAGLDSTQIDSPLLLSLGTVSYVIKPREKVRMGVEIEKMVAEIGERYLQTKNKRLTVSSGARTPLEQAQAMHTLKDIAAVYPANSVEVREIVEARAKIKNDGGSPQKQVQAMGEAIEAQVSQYRYVSRHLYDGAADISDQGIDLDALKKILDPLKPGVFWKHHDGHHHVQLMLHKFQVPEVDYPDWNGDAPVAEPTEQVQPVVKPPGHSPNPPRNIRVVP